MLDPESTPLSPGEDSAAGNVLDVVVDEGASGSVLTGEAGGGAKVARLLGESFRMTIRFWTPSFAFGVPPLASDALVAEGILI